MKLHKKAFTLIEILIAIAIVTIVLISGFQAYTMVLAGKVRLIEKTDLQKEAFFLTERLFQTIKEGGTIDYEEYFNRKVVNADDMGGALYKSGHYLKNTGFGNFGKGGNPGISDRIATALNYGDGFYYCRSSFGVDDKMDASSECYKDERFSSDEFGNIVSGIYGQPQRYGQYSFQFADYNSNYDDDKGDEDGNGNILGDNDDEINIGNGPVVFATGSVDELYLISGDKKVRTIFRYNAKQDPNAPEGSTCDSITGKGDGCLGTIEFLKLDGKDWGIEHVQTAPDDKYKDDGVIDTWLVNEKFSGKPDEVAGTLNTDSYFKPLFSEDLNVSDFNIFLYPNKDQNKAYRDDVNKMLAPYVQLSFTLEPSWEMRSKIRGEVKPIYFNQTIALTDIFSK